MLHLAGCWFRFMTVIKYSSPGKVILSGEHSVVYGKPALASSINLKLHFSIQDDKKRPENLPKGLDLVERIVVEYLSKNGFEIALRGFNYKIDSDIPISEGFGSSAAFSVATTAAFLEFYSGRKFEKVVINQLAYEAEKMFHENPSGIDNSVSCFGGLVYFRKETEFLKTIHSLDFYLPEKWKNSLFMVFSGSRRETTAELVASVKQLYLKDPENYLKIFNQIEDCTKEVLVSCKTQDFDLFKKGVNRNQELLEKLGVIGKIGIEKVRELQNFGSVKMTGAGGVLEGSGYLLVVCDPEKKDSLISYLNQYKIKFYPLIPDSRGLMKI